MRRSIEKGVPKRERERMKNVIFLLDAIVLSCTTILKVNVQNEIPTNRIRMRRVHMKAKKFNFRLTASKSGICKRYLHFRSVMFSTCFHFVHYNQMHCCPFVKHEFNFRKITFFAEIGAEVASHMYTHSKEWQCVAELRSVYIQSLFVQIISRLKVFRFIFGSN